MKEARQGGGDHWSGADFCDGQSGVGPVGEHHTGAEEKTVRGRTGAEEKTVGGNAGQSPLAHGYREGVPEDHRRAEEKVVHRYRGFVYVHCLGWAWGPADHRRAEEKVLHRYRDFL